MMSYSRRSRYSRSPSPYKRFNRSVSRSLSRSRSRSRSLSRDVDNPGNNLYVTGLSPRVTKRDLEKHFATEGNVLDVHLVVDPRTRESRGFGFVTMSSLKEADRCIKYLNRSILEGRVIMVEKAKRRRGRTPTPGRYLGLKTIRIRRRSPSYSPRRSPIYSPYRRRSYSRSPHSSDRSRSRSYSPYYSRQRSYSPYYSRQRSYSPCYSRRHRSYSPSRSPYSRSPVIRRHDDYERRHRDYSPDDYYYERRHRDYSPADYYYERRHRSRYRSVSRSISPRWRRSRRNSRSYSRSSSPRYRSSRRTYSCSVSPLPRSSRRSYTRSISPNRRSSRSHRSSLKRYHSPESYSRSPSRSLSRSQSVSASSRSATSRSTCSP